jgi:hypothetical protein
MRLTFELVGLMKQLTLTGLIQETWTEWETKADLPEQEEILPACLPWAGHWFFLCLNSNWSISFFCVWIIPFSSDDSAVYIMCLQIHLGWVFLLLSCHPGKLLLGWPLSWWFMVCSPRWSLWSMEGTWLVTLSSSKAESSAHPSQTFST